MLKIIGETTINPVLFYSGKISGYITWGILLLSLIAANNQNKQGMQTVISYIFLCTGLILAIISSINLGKSTRLGIVKEDHLLPLSITIKDMADTLPYSEQGVQD